MKVLAYCLCGFPFIATLVHPESKEILYNGMKEVKEWSKHDDTGTIDSLPILTSTCKHCKRKTINLNFGNVQWGCIIPGDPPKSISQYIKFTTKLN